MHYRGGISITGAKMVWCHIYLIKYREPKEWKKGKRDDDWELSKNWLNTWISRMNEYNV